MLMKYFRRIFTDNKNGQKVKKKLCSWILYKIIGKKGISKKIELPLEIIENDSSLTVKAVMLINRKDYNIGGRSLFLSNNVKVQVEYSAIKS